MNFVKRISISNSEFQKMNFKKWISKNDFENLVKWIMYSEFLKVRIIKWVPERKFRKVIFNKLISKNEFQISEFEVYFEKVNLERWVNFVKWILERIFKLNYLREFFSWICQ